MPAAVRRRRTSMTEAAAVGSVDIAWAAARLGPRDERVLTARLTHTLAEIAAPLGVTRERVRQIERAATTRLVAALVEQAPDTVARVRALFEDQVVVSDERVREHVDSLVPARRDVILKLLGVERPAAWGQVAEGWWVSSQRAYTASLRRVADAAPFDDADLTDAARAAGLSAPFPIADALTADGSPVLRHPATGCWVRRGAR